MKVGSVRYSLNADNIVMIHWAADGFAYVHYCCPEVDGQMVQSTFNPDEAAILKKLVEFYPFIRLMSADGGYGYYLGVRHVAYCHWLDSSVFVHFTVPDVQKSGMISHHFDGDFAASLHAAIVHGLNGHKETKVKFLSVPPSSSCDDSPSLSK